MKEELAKLDPESIWERRVAVLTKLKSDVDPGLVHLFAGFLDHLANGGKLKHYLSDNNIAWQELASVYVKRPEVYLLFDHAKKLGEVIRQMSREDEADRRGMDGVEHPIYQGGRLVGTEQKYSDTLLALMMKAGDPDKFADRQKFEHRGVVLNMVIEGIERGTTPPEVKAAPVPDDGDYEEAEEV